MEERPEWGISVLRKLGAPRTQYNGSKIITPRRKPVYPISAERELARYMLAYTNMVINTSAPIIKRVMRGYVEREEFRTDDTGDFISSVRGMRFRVAEKLSEKTGAMKRIEKGYEKTGEMALKHSVSDWDDQVRDALKMKIDRDAYKESMEYLVDNWIHQNVSKIGSIPSEYLTEVEEIIRWGYQTHQPKVNVYRRLEKLVGLSRSKALMIGRDQMGTLNCQLTRYEHESAGVSKYKWITKRDDRVRDCHRELHGTIHDWNDPPPMWYMTKSRGIVFTGRYCHPGEDYSCRCVAAPVFDLEGAVQLLQQKFAPL